MEGRAVNPAISQLEAFITRLDRQRAHIELSLMDQTRPAQEQEQLKQTYDLLFELRQIAVTSLTINARSGQPTSARDDLYRQHRQRDAQSRAMSSRTRRAAEAIVGDILRQYVENHSWAFW